jgi:hypothetical protein
MQLRISQLGCVVFFVLNTFNKPKMQVMINNPSILLLYYKGFN